MVREIQNQKEFDELIKKDVTLVDFWAEWCMPCIMFASTFESLSKKFKNINFAKVNVDNNEELSVRFGIDKIPCIIIFKRGKLVEKITPALPEREFEEKLRKLQ